MIKICLICSREFKTSHKKLRCCSRSCSSKWKSMAYRGSQNPNWRGGQFDKKCTKCGVAFTAKDCRTKLCSCCKILRREQKPNWNGGSELITINCACCGKSISLERKRVRYGRKYCSISCSNIIKNKTNKKRNTEIENIIESWLIQNQLPYKSQVPLNGIALADFVVGTDLIFCDGDYWHSLPGRHEKDVIQTNKLRYLGYRVHRLTGTEIKAGCRPILGGIPVCVS